MHKVMNLNLFGHVAMTKKCLPLLIPKRDSHVVSLCSVVGYVNSADVSTYSASKYALKSFFDCLRVEVAPWNLRVKSIIEPGAMKTPILKSYGDIL
jgi:dehydrogenase/reductase SDR family protein 7B